MAKGSDARKGSRWSYSAGRPPYTVRVFERKGSPNIYCAVWDDAAGQEVKWSLKHDDREKAKDYADERAVKLRRGAEEKAREAGEPNRTVGRILDLYLEHRTPDKGSASSRKGDKRRAQLWKNVLGPGFDLPDLSRREWDPFLRKRRSGAIDARGRPVPEKERTPVGDRTLELDCRFLRAVCNWAMGWRDDSGQMLLEKDPTRGLEIPKEKNPKRPMATDDRADAIREVYRQVSMRVERDGSRSDVESWLPEIFEVVVGTGRRISAVCALRVENVHLEKTARAPYGAITWPADTDKMDRESRAPISATVRKAIEDALEKRKAQGIIGNGPLFPSCKDPSEPVSRHTVTPWLRKAETKAGLDPQEGSTWHAYRRRWATVRKHLPDKDVARVGGWSEEHLQALKQAYQHADEETMLQVVECDRELREVQEGGQGG
jgi:integrase